METIAMCIHGDGEACEDACSMFKKCWGIEKDEIQDKN